MSNLEQAFGKKFNKDNVRIRTFDFNGHTFKVKIPLSSEYESILVNVQEVDDAIVEKYYTDLSSEFIKNKETMKDQKEVEFKDNDVIVQGRSMRETAKNKAISENRIVAMIRLLVPEEKDFNMETITYDMVDELFPFSVQLELVEEIGNVISPSYKAIKGK
jgi:6-pyruvoyl-tetrahydropterin synthase